MSNRSSHFAHRFQTLPSALAGVPGSRRLLALAVVLAVLALALLTPGAQAQTVAPDDVAVVPEDWSLIPRGVSPGEQFRLIFLTSTTRDASSTDIGDYNTFVQNLAAAGHDDIREYQRRLPRGGQHRRRGRPGQHGNDRDRRSHLLALRQQGRRQLRRLLRRNLGRRGCSQGRIRESTFTWRGRRLVLRQEASKTGEWTHPAEEVGWGVPS